jgi:glutamate N-acetyltransferase/amino-acid N-acetyltransferase
MTTLAPRGFVGVSACVGLKDHTDDFALVAATTVDTTSAAMHTQSRFAGASVLLNRAADLSKFRGIVALSKNANVATDDEGLANATEVRQRAAALAGCAPEEILIASTGVIGVQYPMSTVRKHLEGLETLVAPADFDACAKAIMTTDNHPKLQARRCGNAVVLGIAKGVGMIEPNMATMLAFFFTDAKISADTLDTIFRRVVATTFNAVSIDTDTSTSDTASIIANGQAGPVDLGQFETALHECALELVKSIARDGEGATKLIEVAVTGARDDAQAKRVGKAVVNSPLVKTAIHGADPNWGRVTMAIGKCESDTDIAPAHVTITFGDGPVYPDKVTTETLAALRHYLCGDTVHIGIDLGIDHGTFTVYGCDLTEGYVHLNADYTT